VPSVNTAGIACVWQPTNEEDEMSTQIDKGRCNQLLQLVNKKPKWDNEHGGHVLNFQGRVTESSVKNFQLCPLGASSSSESFQDDVALQFGRVGKHRFSLDVRFPMSPIQVK
jgi:tubby-related protein 1